MQSSSKSLFEKSFKKHYKMPHKELNLKHFLRRTACILFAAISFAALSVSFGANAVTITTFSSPDDNSTPIPENSSFSTYRNIAISGTLSAIDPDGDDMTFSLASSPKKGTAEIDSSGEFTYTPYKNKKGADSFTFLAKDALGNVSKEGTVKINIKKQSSNVTYSDMDGSHAHYAALCLAENGIFTGEHIGDQYFFRPAEEISRSQFLAMCLKAAGIDPLDSITKTGFYDDSEISSWAKPYISAALMTGIIQGSTTEDGKTVFSPDESITYAQACVIVNNILGISDVSSSGSVSQDICPSWSYQAAVNLTACNITACRPISSLDDHNAPITRADAACMIQSMMDLIKK